MPLVYFEAKHLQNRNSLERDIRLLLEKEESDFKKIARDMTQRRRRTALFTAGDYYPATSFSRKTTVDVMMT